MDECGTVRLAGRSATRSGMVVAEQGGPAGQVAHSVPDADAAGARPPGGPPPPAEALQTLAASSGTHRAGGSSPP
jgi:hypothetical protein